MATTATVRDDQTPGLKKSSSFEWLPPNITDDQTPGLKKRRSSFLWIPPNMSELRVVLLGNSWCQRSSVGNFILEETVFNTEEEPDHCLRVRRYLKDTHIVLINTPDLLQPNISDDKLTEHVQTCVRLSDPGPHVFLLVLQPEDFTEEHKLRLQSVLENLSDQSFDHSLVLTSADRDQSSDFRHMKPPPLTDMIRMCRSRHLWLKDLERPELLTRLGQIVKENDGDHVSCDVFEDTTSTLPADYQRPKQEEPQTSVLDAVKAAGLNQLKKIPAPGSEEKPFTHTSELRIVLLGKSEDKKIKLGNFIIKAKALYDQKTKKCVASCGEWRGNPVTVVKTPDVFSLSVEEMNSCVTLCSPGPNVLLLLVKPSDFTEQNRQTLKSILSLFGPDALKHSMVITTRDGSSTAVRDLLGDCGGRHYSMTEDNHTSLMQKIEKIVHENRRTFLTFRPKSEHIKPALNLVLCGRRGAGKTSAAEAVLGHAEFYSVSDSSESVQGHGEVCGRWVSLVELPALYGKAQEEVMKESLRCVSLCHPEGVHAFILVLPVGPLTDEDKGELKTIQNTFSSRVDDFTMILFTVESDPTAPDVVNFVNENRDIQEILQSCGGRHVVVNIKDRQQIPELLDMMENMRVRPITDKPHSYTTETFAFSQIEKISSLQTELDLSRVSDDEEQGPECLRIVLIGKTGSGKSASGNTILGRKAFKSELCQTSVTRLCQKEQDVVDGRPVVVVDTPGLFDTTLSHDEINEEMVKCVSLLAPGPHVFLLVLQIGRFTPEEKETLKLIKEAFGKNAQQFTFILFTRGDELERAKKTIDEYIQKSSDASFKKLITDCGRRYHVFNNCDVNNHTQVRELMTKINTMVKTNGGRCYTNEMLQEAEAAIKKEMERILKEKEEEMRRDREELQGKHEEEMKGMRRKMEEQRAGTEEERKLREKQLEEMEEKIKREQEEKRKEQEMREKDNKKRKQQEQTQKLEWEQKLASLEEKIRSESESKEKISRELEKNREDMRREQEKEEKKQKEWWEERRQKDEQRQQEEERRIRKLQKEYEQKRKEENRIRREQEEKEKEDMKEEQRARMEEERKVREKQLEEMKEKIKKEQEEKKKERKMREEENKKRKQQEQTQKHQWEQKLTSLEEKIRSESESKEKISRELKKCREDMRREREKWEKKQIEMFEKRRQEDEQRQKQEERRIRKLQEELRQERENDEKKRKEEDRIRREREVKEKKDIKEKYEKKLENVKKTHEEKARKTAEEFNEFKEKYKKIFEDQKEEHEKEMKEKDEQYDLLQALKVQNEEELKKKHLSQFSDLVKCVTKDRKNITKINNLLTKQEKEMMKTTTEEEKKRLLQKHEDEKSDLTQKLLKEDVSAWNHFINLLFTTFV